MSNIYDDTTCADCRKETNHLRREDNNAEWYKVKDEIWLQAIQPKHANFLCIGCLEKRIKRKLVPEDFPHIPINSDSGYGRSRRLRNRIGNTKKET